MKTGIQISSFRPLLRTEREVAFAFEKMTAMGCKCVQLQWIEPSVPISHIVRCLRSAGMESAGVQDFYEIIRQNRDYYISLNRESGGKWMCVSRIPERLKTRAGLDVFVEELRSIQRELDAWGQVLCIHPVSADFVPIDGIDPVEYILTAMPELHICADLYHLNRVCGDMPGWLRRYAGRVCMVHFKEGFQGTLVPPGQGETDWTGVFPACHEIGVEYAFAEQETWEGDPFDRLKEGLDWVNEQNKKSG